MSERPAAIVLDTGVRSAFEGSCDPAAAKKVRDLASKTAQANNRVRDFV